MISKLGASNNQAVRASCCCKVGRLLIEFIAIIIENMSGSVSLHRSTHSLLVNYSPASSIHLAAASSKASCGDFTPVNASWIASCNAAEASL